MPDYKKISNRLTIALCEIIDKAQAAIEEAEENIISDEANSVSFEIITSKETEE